MSEIIRVKGKFRKKKEVVKIDKAIQLMNSKKEFKRKTDVKVIEGRRLVELNVLANNLTCCNCENELSLKNIVDEKSMGLNSILKVHCQQCFVINDVYTGKTHKSSDGQILSDVNSKIVFGAIHAGIGCTALNKILACANVPSVSFSLFKRYEREVGVAVEAAAEKSCQKAAKLERQLIIENLEKLCEEFPMSAVVPQVDFEIIGH